MGYMADIDRWLGVLLQELGEGKISEGEVTHAIREKLLESYKNGLKAAGQSPTPHEQHPRRFERPRRK